MIISHRHKFIFIKTEKTAGTSTEIALSEFCGSEDVITPISPEDEQIRKEWGFRGPQNYSIPFSRYSRGDLLRAVMRRKPLRFFNHAGAEFIRGHLEPEIWETYFKFCFERNSYDKVLSWYYWRTRKRREKPSISEFIASGEAATIKGFELYSHNSMLLMDRVFKYEELTHAMEQIRDLLELPDTPRLPVTKGTHRTDRRHYRKVLTESDRENIERVFAREIAYFGYVW